MYTYVFCVYKTQKKKLIHDFKGFRRERIEASIYTDQRRAILTIRIDPH